MKKIFSISQAAKMADITTETLRHYDRIGLVHPCQTDEWTGYRYYSEQEIVRLNIVRALRCMDMPLQEIKKILEIADIKKIILFLQEAEKKADKKIAELCGVKERILRAKRFYEEKREKEPKREGMYLREMPMRAVLLSQSLREPSIDNLWNYHRHFYAQLSEERKEDFSFEDLAGIYEEGETKCMFVLCSRFAQVKDLKILPGGRYLCAECTEETRAAIQRQVLETAKAQFSVNPAFCVFIVVLTGILQWKYEMQVFIAENK